jgi:hypothetical protein
VWKAWELPSPPRTPTAGLEIAAHVNTHTHTHTHTVSALKVLKVVKLPQKPVATISLAVGLSWAEALTAPNTKDPAMFTPATPQGSMLCCDGGGCGELRRVLYSVLLCLRLDQDPGVRSGGDHARCFRGGGGVPCSGALSPPSAAMRLPQPR